MQAGNMRFMLVASIETLYPFVFQHVTLEYVQYSWVMLIRDKMILEQCLLKHNRDLPFLEGFVFYLLFIPWPMGIRNLLSSDCSIKLLPSQSFHILSGHDTAFSGHEIIVLSQLLTTMKSLDLKDFRSHSRSCFFLNSECKQLFYCILLNAFWSY